jgi:hypothetical protein
MTPGRVRCDPQDGARKIERWAFYFAREVVESVNSLWRAIKPEPAPP